MTFWVSVNGTILGPLSLFPANRRTECSNLYGRRMIDIELSAAQITAARRAFSLIFSITYRDAACRGSPMPPPTRCGVRDWSGADRADGYAAAAVLAAPARGD